jgi:hypothetical protein
MSQRSSPRTSPGSAIEPARGALEPRLWTRPLRELTPATSYGYDVIDFAANVLRMPLDPWQAWLAIHAGELMPDGSPRFRRILVLVARQNGKTHLLVVLAAYWLFIEAGGMVLGTSTKLAYARESWAKMVRAVDAAPDLDGLHDRRWTRRSNGEVEAWTHDAEVRYLIAAANDDAGRSLTLWRLILDELRQHHNYDTWDAAYNATAAVFDAQTWAITNAGTERSIVLNDLRDEAIEGGDPALGHFEWSSPPDADVRDVAALAAANPSLGDRMRVDALVAEASAALRAGGQRLAGFKTEKMCITVRVLDPAIDPGAWGTCRDPGSLDKFRDRVAMCVDVAPDGQHVTLAAAAILPDDRARVEIVEAWAGVGAADRAGRDLPALIRRARPRVLGWLPNGPAAELAAALGGPRWPRWTPLEEIRAEVPAACMALRSMVLARRLAHSGDPLLDAHIEGAERIEVGDRWVFGRRGRGHVDAVYAVAGSVQLARGLPPPVGKPRIVLVTDE